MRFNLDKIVKNLQSRAPSMYLGTVTEVSSDARCSVLIDGTDYPITGIRTLAHVTVGDRVQLIHDKRRIVILGAIQRTDKFCPFPIGYIVTNQGEDPATHWTGTTWERYAEGRALVGQDTSQVEFDTIGKTGGAKTHTLTTAQMPSHSHHIYNYQDTAPVNDGHSHVISTDVLVASSKGWYNVKTSPAGSGQAHNNLQPYAVVAHWRRTA